MPAALAFAPVPALAAALLAPGGAPLVLFPPPLRMTLTLDVPAAMLLGVAALLWIVAGAYAATYLRGKPNAGRFVEWWLLTLSGSLGVFMAADLVSFYLTYSVVSLAAYGLVVHDGTPGAPAGRRRVCRSCGAGRGLFADGVSCSWRRATPERQPADTRCRSGAAGVAVARCVAGAADPGLRLEDWPRAGPCVDAACLSRGADPRRCRAERCGGQGRRDRADPLSAARSSHAGVGRSAGRLRECSRPSTVSWSGSPKTIRGRYWPIPASARWGCWRRCSAWDGPRATPAPGWEPASRRRITSSSRAGCFSRLALPQRLGRVYGRCCYRRRSWRWGSAACPSPGALWQSWR